MKSLASLGIGAATVDTRLITQTLQAGEKVNGIFSIRGGHVAQQIEQVYLYLVIRLLKDGVKTNYTLRKYELNHPFTIQANAKMEIPFHITLPLSAPLYTGNYPIYLKTGLDIKHSLDPHDQDRVEIRPHPLVQKLLKQVEDAGFILYRIYNEYDPRQKPDSFVQVFEYRHSGKYHGMIDALNVYFYVNEYMIQMNLEMVRDTKIFTSHLVWEYPHGAVYVDNKQTLTDPLTKVKQILQGQWQ
ncbi:sporulation protein [Laceyella putida]|uniref:Sporulation protein n=1 Tax=Laceyella putida TaxID=110101 RepID=A0ABW2RLS5_9BACL